MAFDFIRTLSAASSWVGNEVVRDRTRALIYSASTKSLIVEIGCDKVAGIRKAFGEKQQNILATADYDPDLFNEIAIIEITGYGKMVSFLSISVIACTVLN